MITLVPVALAVGLSGSSLTQIQFPAAGLFSNLRLFTPPNGFLNPKRHNLDICWLEALWSDAKHHLVLLDELGS